MTARDAAVRLLMQTEEDKSFVSLALKQRLSKLLQDDREKAFATELIYGSVRYKKQLDFVRDLYCKIKPSKLSPAVIQIIRISVYQLLHCEKIPQSAVCNEAVKLAKQHENMGAASFVNGLLRTVCKQKDKIPYPEDALAKLGITESFSKSILDIWIEDFGFEKAAELAKWSNIPKKASYRINRLKAPCGYMLKETLGNPENEKDFSDGFITVQDKGSMLAVETLLPVPHSKVLDLCAAPGGKSCYIAEFMKNTGEIIACDIYSHRLELINKTAERLGAENIISMENDGSVLREEWIEKFDFVLADVPCSGLGVISGKPDIKWRKQDYKSLCSLQFEILKNAMQYVKKGGVLVYSTCTVHKAENIDIVNKALSENPAFEVVGEPVQLFPNNEHDGFFVCKMKRCE